jgi:large subunit ribosomal protein L4
MATLDVFNMKREKVGSIDLADEVFATEVKEQLFYEVVKAQLASRRAGTQSAKERAAVSGSTKKLYKQKGTGRARHGSIRAPIYVGGGRAHPPRPRDWSYRPPRQVRVGALRSALSKFNKEGRLVVVDRFELAEVKTKGLIAALGTLRAAKKALVVDAATNENLKLSIRNCEDHQFLPPEGLNVYDLLRHDTLVLSKDAAKALELRCMRKPGDGAGEVSESAPVVSAKVAPAAAAKPVAKKAPAKKETEK